MNKERLKKLADFLGTLIIHEQTKKPVSGQYVHKMDHREWSYSCIRIGNMSASELGELPTVFPEHWEVHGFQNVIYKDKPELEFWAAIRDFFDITQGDDDLLFMWGDGNKKKCKKKGLLHQGATRTDVANHIAIYIGEQEY